MTKHVEDTYAKIAHVYAQRFFDDTSDLPFIDMLAQQLKPGSKILDVGSGPGQFSKYLLERGFRVEGIDSSPEMVTIAKEKVHDGTFTTMDMRQLAYADESFDGVLVAYSLIHIPTPELAGVLGEIRRVTKPGGPVLFIAQDGEPDHVVDDPRDMSVKLFINFFTKERIAGILEAAGFKIISQTTLGQAGAEDLSAKAIGTLVARVG